MKIDRKERKLFSDKNDNGYFMYWNEAEKKGYSGVRFDPLVIL